ncbi:hypothetical protein QQF64_003854 [Cirrhinus molitorella]|uniref:Uncharacterized protein n=1 Tax=Cirrhinus molitorella TaxID=172907 RepID=A0ABR3MMH5_9TELE
MTGFDYDLIASRSTVLQDKSGLAQLNSISIFTFKFHYDTHLMLLRLINYIHKPYLRVQTLVRPSLASLGSKGWPNRPAFPFLTQTSEPNETLCEQLTVYLLEEKRVHPDVSLMYRHSILHSKASMGMSDCCKTTSPRGERLGMAA